MLMNISVSAKGRPVGNSQLVRAWSSKDVVNYYLTHRDDIDDLYDSEKYFIEDTLKRGRSLLDIGCATGGFSKIVKKYNNKIIYAGVDISPVMIDEAKKRFPNYKFYVSDGLKLDFPDESFDVCICFGVLHMMDRWRELLTEAWRVCSTTLLFDLRIAEKRGICNAELSYQRLEFNGKWDGISKAPYVVASLDEAIRCIKNMRPKIKCIRSYGYWHPVSETTISTYEDVCMSAFCLEKKSPSSIIDWQLPLSLSNRSRRNLIERNYENE